MIPVIICGGIGSKMWPESRAKSPKHFLPLINGKSLFQKNYETLRLRYKAEEIYLQTNSDQAKIAKLQEPEIPIENIFVEPEMRNHGPASGLAAALLYKKGFMDEPFMLVQADDLRVPEEKFLDMMELCDKLARERKEYITGGMKPEFAVMGVDYLIKGEKLMDLGGVEAFAVDKFLWRSTKEAVEEFVKDGKALVHVNHTCMTPRNFLEMYKKYKLEWYEPLMRIVEGGDIEVEYALMPKGPIEDVTQLVHANKESIVIETPFSWLDFGTWEFTDKILRSMDLYKQGENVATIDANNNFVRTKKFTAIIGLNDLVVVETDDALLIMPKSQSGRVGEVVDKLKAEGKTELL